MKITKKMLIKWEAQIKSMNFELKQLYKLRSEMVDSVWGADWEMATDNIHQLQFQINKLCRKLYGCYTINDMPPHKTWRRVLAAAIRYKKLMKPKYI